MSTCPCVRRSWMDFNLWAYQHCALPSGHNSLHRDAYGEEWGDAG